MAETPKKTQAAKKAAAPQPTVGRIVLYCLTEADCEAINRRREDGQRNMVRHTGNRWGVQVHVGNMVQKDDLVAMIITATWGQGVVNGKCFLDGSDDFWATSVSEGDGAGTWRWPERK